jgi:putative hydrolase of the HAD superfamily
MPLCALIFDFDGLVIDTESAIYEAWREFYALHDQPLTTTTWAQCVGTDFGHYNPKTDLEQLTGKSFDWQQIEAALEARVRDLLTTYDALPGVRALLADAAACGIPCSIASSSPLSWVEGWLEQLKLRDAFQNVSCREHVARIKPAPDLFLDAAQKLGAAPTEVVVLEDSLNGLRAALAAGMRCVSVPGPTTRHLDLGAAWMQAESLAELNVAMLQRSFH